MNRAGFADNLPSTGCHRLRWGGALSAALVSIRGLELQGQRSGSVDYALQMHIRVAASAPRYSFSYCFTGEFSEVRMPAEYAPN